MQIILQKNDDSSNSNSNDINTCCSWDNAKQLTAKLTRIVGEEHVLQKKSAAKSIYLKGARLGYGEALCVVRPGTLSEAVECLKAIVESGAVVVPQGANTGLTGGSVPRSSGSHDPRPSVVLSMRRLNLITPMDDGTKLLCFAGAGIADVGKSANAFDREGHSVLGSIFLNPSVAAGVAFGSGGTQLRKGPAYTDRALYCRVNADGKTVEVVNKLGIVGSANNDDVLQMLDNLQQPLKDNHHATVIRSDTNSPNGRAKASDSQYPKKVCMLDGSVARFNADTSGLEVNRSEGKVLILATVHDTFPRAQTSRLFWISCDSLETALDLRKRVCLASEADLPTSCEYMDRDSFDIIDQSGRVLCAVIHMFGVGEVVRRLWDLKLRIESISGLELVCDQAMHFVNNVFPQALPSNLMKAGRTFDHHLMLEVGEYGDGTEQRLLDRLNAFEAEYNANKHQSSVQIHECTTTKDVNAVKAFRFAAAPAFRTWCVGENVQGLSVDYALPKNGGLAPEMSISTATAAAAIPLKRMRYSHFGCNVVHEDLAYGLDVNVHDAKMEFKKAVEQDGGKLPAEHGHGTEYKAPLDAQERWKGMDPSNTMNPGVGGLPVSANYK
uniref:FAD-binding PCMH-type domain-containing protein n=1 Tax=Leptocylindrus danicus TaxID=163516 RepID=A0A7S2KDW8_9STRA|mmetsp:Transcript_21763/g.32523  ORF Transcript_21763/g.32523 Transcript_21763/m.32523 type:complete len:610 (+) Transcript_21763:412-2241(+)